MGYVKRQLQYICDKTVQLDKSQHLNLNSLKCRYLILNVLEYNEAVKMV